MIYKEKKADKIPNTYKKTELHLKYDFIKSLIWKNLGIKHQIETFSTTRKYISRMRSQEMVYSLI